MEVNNVSVSQNVLTVDHNGPKCVPFYVNLGPDRPPMWADTGEGHLCLQYAVWTEFPNSSIEECHGTLTERRVRQ